MVKNRQIIVPLAAVYTFKQHWYSAGFPGLEYDGGKDVEEERTCVPAHTAQHIFT